MTERGPEAAPGGRLDLLAETPTLRSALTRYRVMAYVVGVWLLVLVLVAMPLKHFAHSPGMVHTVGPVHGFLYILFLLAALDLATRCRWPLGRTVGVLLAGTVPFLSFVVERRVTRRVRSEGAGPPRR